MGLKVGWESGIGFNAAYYADGNRYWETWPNDPSHDPLWPTNVADNPPTYGFQQIGYAALKTAGIKSSGTITEGDLAEVSHRHLEDLAKSAIELGIPREKILTHVFTWQGKGMNHKAASNAYSGPGWSFYGSDPGGVRSTNKDVDSAVIQSLSEGAPAWGMVEAWLFSPDYGPWYEFLMNALVRDGTDRLVSLYNWDAAVKNPAILKAARDAAAAGPAGLVKSPPRKNSGSKSSHVYFDGRTFRAISGQGNRTDPNDEVRLPDGRQ